MKILFQVMVLFLLSNCNHSKPQETITIQEIEEILEIDLNLDQFQDKDVRIFKRKLANPENVMFNTNAEHQNNQPIFYCLVMFRIEDGQLKDYRAFVKSTFTYEKVNFEWINDSTVTFNFKNKFHEHEIYTVSGYGGTTKLTWL
ncbi:hypothetical protein [Aegicerativicinus sediminis]|uniref:hypothetical protein n=1 Tax=Aegicerativicinus sediminis TaxID=2893202 RepID=UPI001E44C424|nr:hypothetical protein [Aegicerativicinus sediminis]